MITANQQQWQETGVYQCIKYWNQVDIVYTDRVPTAFRNITEEGGII